MKVSLVACCKTKGVGPQPAASLYTSALFRKSLLAALDKSDIVYILSGKYGALKLGTIVEPYDLALGSMKKSDRLAWGDLVREQISGVVSRKDIISLYCGDDYIKPLAPYLHAASGSVDLPLGTLSMGARLSELRLINSEARLERDGAIFRQLMSRLAIGLGNAQAIARAKPGRLPNRGLYFICAEEETTRVVRVGTHAVSRGSRTTLWDRLSTHRGTRDGRGSHRSSIFRSHVGRALIAAQPSLKWPSTWGVGQKAPLEVRQSEESLERAVSAYIGSLGLLWLDVPDDASPTSDRAYLERNAIGLLSRLGILHCRDTASWLGLQSHDWRIAATGLWNLNYILARPDKTFLDIMEHYVDATLGKVAMPDKSIAPKDWHSRTTLSPRNQLDLFSFEGAVANADA